MHDRGGFVRIEKRKLFDEGAETGIDMKEFYGE
jgi:hypothetical protein